ncbi:MAG: dihydroorotate dehydrogenase [Negativicutes bacterium]|nr:dihydroorotate dehydrogenase [Negativicutes bacterium]
MKIDQQKLESLLAVEVAGIKMKTPVMGASGTFGYGEEFADFVDWRAVGGIVAKGLTLAPRRGNPGRRIVETPAGMLNSIGLQNPGVKVFAEEILPRIKDYAVPIIANINGGTVDEYGRVAEALEGSAVAGLEVNISCPNTEHGCMAFGVIPETAAQVVRTVKQATTLPVIVKLSPNVTDIAEIAQAVEAAGADAISLINTLVGLAIDINTWRPVLGNVTGGLSGPAVKPVAVRMVWQVARAVKIPVIGMGGISCAEDAVEFLLAGASAVQVGAANFVNPRAVSEVAHGLADYLTRRGLNHVSQLVGQMKTEG